MEHHGTDAMCCGGGGGRMWMETAIGERFADLRVKEAQEAGVELIVTACPDCLSCLEDSVKGLENTPIRVMDLVELVDLSARTNSPSP
jgi:Fe-S oxidoreductase